jgi:hypothetical protein
LIVPEFCDWLSHTAASNAISTDPWVIPAVQTVHILAVTVVMAPMMMLDLRMIGVAGRRRSIAEMADRLIPPIWIALIVLLTTGIILTIGEPARELTSNAFRLKMVLVISVSLLTFFAQRKIQGNATFWEERRGAAIAIGATSLLMWLTIATAGRWIAYLDHG